MFKIFTLGRDDNATRETFTVAAGRSGRIYWAICDDCGLPFKYRGESAVATAATSQTEINLKIGPCEHCRGIGRPVLARADDGARKIVANSPEFANALLLALAERLRSGELDPLAVAAELRTQGTPVMTRIADWIESRPATANAATTAICAVLGIAATLLATQIDADAGQSDPHTYDEQQVEQILETIIDRYEQRQPASPPDPPTHGSGPSVP
ncbi:hypothetical protein ABTX24_16500 [Nocardioides sp. NPDC127514]|uniref:hypothetical protein n=1 Tax=unclassified Nocardioides TaxID=2615069 RepID=UPI003321EF6A